MKHTKIIIAFVLLFMVIGFAAVTTSLSLNADMELLGDLDSFVIYYSRAVVNGEEDPTGCADWILIGNISNDSNAVRPVVTVSKEYVSSQ